ncbi:MAG: flippase-like domain-containing protein [Candidatus Caenarcaniphilales bacterium]|nr:flippase-like domain-containing protein [Candidatus Caenarcaniphilales bacterium]
MSHNLQEETKASKDKKSNIKSLLIKVSVSALFIFVLIKIIKIDINSFIDQIKNLDPLFFSLACIFALICILTNTYRWWIITKVFKYNFSYSRALIWYFEGMFANNFLPSNIGGDALRAYHLANTNFQDNSDNTWLNAGLTVFLERIFGFIMMFFFLPFGMLALYFFKLDSLIPENLLPVLILLSFCPFIVIASYKLWLNLPIPLKIFQKIKLAVKAFAEGKKEVFIVIAWTFITHLSLMGLNICSAFASGLGFNEIPAWYWLLIIPFGTLSSFIIPAMKGVGAKELTYIFLLGLLGIGKEQSFVVAIAVFLATTISTVPGVIILRRYFNLIKV